MPHLAGKNAKKKSSSSTTKRNFTVVMGNKEHGLYVSSSPSSAARKAVSKLCASNKSKKVQFHIREITQKSEKKTYGPYLGYIEKLEKPIELKGRIIRYKPVAKLSEKIGKKSVVKKGVMRGGRHYVKYLYFTNKKQIAKIIKEKLDELYKDVGNLSVNYKIDKDIFKLGNNRFILILHTHKREFCNEVDEQLKNIVNDIVDEKSPMMRKILKENPNIFDSKGWQDSNDTDSEDNNSNRNVNEEKDFIIGEYIKWMIDLKLSDTKSLLEKSISDENGKIILTFSVTDENKLEIVYRDKVIKIKKIEYKQLKEYREIIKKFNDFKQTEELRLYDKYRNQAIQIFGYSFCLKKFNDFVSLFHHKYNILSIGSGNGLFEYFYTKLYNRKIVCIDPNPLKYLGENLKKPFVYPKYRTVKSFLEYGYDKKDFLLFINWAYPGDKYDLEAIELIKPDGFFVIYEEYEHGGIAGSPDFCEIVSNKESFNISGKEYILIEKIKCTDTPDFFANNNACMAFYRIKFPMIQSSNEKLSRQNDSNVIKNSAKVLSAPILSNENLSRQNYIILGCSITFRYEKSSKMTEFEKENIKPVAVIEFNYYSIPCILDIRPLMVWGGYYQFYENSYIRNITSKEYLCSIRELIDYCLHGSNFNNLNKLIELVDTKIVDIDTNTTTWFNNMVQYPKEPKLELVAEDDFKNNIFKYSSPNFASIYYQYKNRNKNKSNERSDLEKMNYYDDLYQEYLYYIKENGEDPILRKFIEDLLNYGFMYYRKSERKDYPPPKSKNKRSR